MAAARDPFWTFVEYAAPDVRITSCAPTEEECVRRGKARLADPDNPWVAVNWSRPAPETGADLFRWFLSQGSGPDDAARAVRNLAREVGRLLLAARKS